MKKKTVLVGGTFNILHPGHIHFLKKAKDLGEMLVVVVAHDKTVKSAGKKLMFPAKQRAELVASLKFVDKVRIGVWPPDWKKIIKQETPDIIALGHDQVLKIKDIESKSSIKIVRINKFGDYSTRKILEK